MITDSIGQKSLSMNASTQMQHIQNPYATKQEEEPSLEETLKNSAVSVGISMRAQVVLMGLQSSDIAKGNASAQNGLENIFNNEEIFNFLSGSENEHFFSLADLGYEGKAITQLDQKEAGELLSSEGFFGIEQTSSRVANFAIEISGDNLQALKEARKGIVKGFEEAEKLWNNNLPEISYKTQESTLVLIDAQISKLEKETLKS